MKKRLAFVVPRYGPRVLGGAESLARAIAEKVVEAGYATIEIFTTCAVNHITWQNDLPAGTTQENGVWVHRFPTAQEQRDHRVYEQLALRLLQQDHLSRAEQLQWVEQSIHSPRLYAALSQRIAAFDLIFLMPYLFGTTFYASALRPERTILWPCLHDEIYAYLDVTRDLFETSYGVLFNAPPEADLAKRIYGFAHPNARVVGLGFDQPPEVQPERFLSKYHLTDPFILYSGRLEAPKNVDLLIDYFERYSRRNHGNSPFKLVLMGSGPVNVPRHPEITSVGFQPTEAEKHAAFASASLLCQPSINESFSIVMMEAWQHQVPVLVNQHCNVTYHHARQSGGGLWFSCYEDFEGVLDELAQNKALRHKLGANGQRYLTKNYSWSAVLDRFCKAVDDWCATAQ